MEENKLKYNVINSFLQLKKYVEKENFKGWDPYDGLNSKIFQLTPFKKWDIARLAWIQGFKRSPINFRKIFFVPKEYNAKGIALFLNGYCNLMKLSDDVKKKFGTKEEIISKINFLADLLLKLKNENYSGACWGYNFDWQARRLFLFPKNTPTVVATSFCASALFRAYEITKNETYLKTALSSADFILLDLNRTEIDTNKFILSYSPLKGNDTVFNASLLGAKTLSFCYKYTKEEKYKLFASKLIKTVIDKQEADGSWVYGLLPVQCWKDSFHTGYNLDAISHYQHLCQDFQFENELKIGFNFYINNFFEQDGTPKYYHNKKYPIDIHCPGQLWVTLNEMNEDKNYHELSKKVMDWTLKNMQNQKGYFYYQIKKNISSKISYMRWSNAFMFNALTYFLISQNGKENN
jgi:rhamnogalacturonyl hydrolase YesR